LSEQSVLSEEEREYFDSTCRAAAEVMVPYIGRCVAAIYPRPSATAATAVVFDLASALAILRPIYEKDLPPAASPSASSLSSSSVTDLRPPSSPAQARRLSSSGQTRIRLTASSCVCVCVCVCVSCVCGVCGV
jgi:hypothetical protein